MNTDRPIRIVLADDHRIITDGLKELLAPVPDVECIGVVTNGEEALQCIPCRG